MCITEIGNISLEQSTVFSQFKNLVHGFTTRKGGVSTGEYSSLSMSPWRGDDIENVRKNEKILCESLSLQIKKLTATKQEHTDTVEIIDESRVGYGIEIPWNKGVDGCITTLKNVPLLCYSADCVPILVYASDIEAVVDLGLDLAGGHEQLGMHAAQALGYLGPDLGGGHFDAGI